STQRVSAHAGDRRNVDNPPAARAHHHPRRFPRAEKRSGQIDSQGFVEFLAADLNDRSAGSGDPSVVHQDVQLVQLLKCGYHLILIADVGGDPGSTMRKRSGLAWSKHGYTRATAN